MRGIEVGAAWRCVLLSTACCCVLVPDLAAAADNEIEDIVVTARKRAESIQETPISVTAFGEGDLGARTARTFSDLLQTIPNVSAANGLQIRGIGYNSRNIGIEAGATVYVDGVYTGRPPSFNQDLTDVARVEVLRGPQGTLYGKNSIAGVVAITTNTPEPELSGKALGQYGNRDSYRVEFTLNAPISSIAAARISVSAAKSDGYLRNLNDDQRFNASEAYGLRGALRLTPSDALTLTLRADHFDLDANPRGFETLLGDDPQSPPPRPIIAPGKYTTVEDSVTKRRLKLSGVAATIDYEASDDLTITSITAYRRNRDTLFEGEDDSLLNNIEVLFSQNQKQFTQELRGFGTLGRLEYVVGGYYFYQDSRQSNQGILGRDFAIPFLGIPGGVKKVIDPQARIKTRSYAAFVDLTYKLNDQFELLAGLRYNREKKDFDFQIISQAQALFYAVPRGYDNFSDNDLSPTLGVRYHVTDEVMAYARYAKGYKSGGWNADFVSATPGKPAPTVRSLRFEPETATTYEVGIKSSLFDRRLTLNGSLFYTDFSNLQVAQFFGINVEDSGNQLAVTANAGAATIKGFELEAVAVPFEGLQLSGGIGYQRAKYDSFANVDGRGTNADGKFLSNVPKFTGNASVTYTVALPKDDRLVFRGDFSSISSRFGDPLNAANRRSPGYSYVNARASYAAKDDAFEVALYSRNLFNRKYIAEISLQQFAVGQAVPSQTVRYGEPRTYGIEVRAQF